MIFASLNNFWIFQKNKTGRGRICWTCVVLGRIWPDAASEKLGRNRVGGGKLLDARAMGCTGEIWDRPIWKRTQNKKDAFNSHA
jgi:hypothetical protein